MENWKLSIIRLQFYQRCWRGLWHQIQISECWFYFIFFSVNANANLSSSDLASSSWGDNGVDGTEVAFCHYFLLLKFSFRYFFIILIFYLHYFNFLNKKRDRNRTHRNGSGRCCFCFPFVHLALLVLLFRQYHNRGKT